MVERHSDEVEVESAHGSSTSVISPDERRVVDDAAASLPRAVSEGRGTGFKSLPAGKWRFEWGERLGVPTCPYVVRWMVQSPWGSLRLHHWLAPDDDRARHDHPWWFVTLVLRGGYVDVSPEGAEHLRASAVRYRPATHRHTVVPDPGGAWTIIVTGPQARQWGFWVKGKFVKSYRYFYRFGHHPCE